MTLKTAMCAFVIALTPALAAAECSWGKMEQVTMSCSEGTTFDAETQTCIPVVSS
jgi:hypothetical protein